MEAMIPIIAFNSIIIQSIHRLLVNVDIAATIGIIGLDMLIMEAQID